MVINFDNAIFYLLHPFLSQWEGITGIVFFREQAALYIYIEMVKWVCLKKIGTTGKTPLNSHLGYIIYISQTILNHVKSMFVDGWIPILAGNHQCQTRPDKYNIGVPQYIPNGSTSISYIWVNYNDLTVTSLEIIVSKGNHPKWP